MKTFIISQALDDGMKIEDSWSGKPPFEKIGAHILPPNMKIQVVHSTGDGDWVYIRHPIHGDVCVKFPNNY